MTRLQKKQLRVVFEIFITAVCVCGWILAELYSQLGIRIFSGVLCLGVAIYFGWRFESRVTLRERYDRAWTAIYGKSLLEAGGSDRLLSVFTKFVEQRDAMDDYGLSKIILADEVARQIPKARHAQDQTPSA